jgi:hypothetical protein
LKIRFTEYSRHNDLNLKRTLNVFAMDRALTNSLEVPLLNVT